MPLKSYLAFPRPGQRDSLTASLSQIPHCQALPAANRDVVVLLTDTPDDPTEATVEESLRSLEHLQFLSLVAGAAETEAQL